ncbi:hypothetical protein LOZ62_005014 [Ophidiomyces ophidiicola]|nr:hypothetical protein LOZ62_005014 [Ophidiomyces ophidiicola]
MAHSHGHPASQPSPAPAVPELKEVEAGYASTAISALKNNDAKILICELSEVPRRKPLPQTASTPSSDPGGTAPIYSTPLASLKKKLALGGNKKKQKIFLGVGIAIMIALILIIGLSVGLTRGCRPSNPPLPLDNGGAFSGDLTYYEPGLGACGISSTGSENVCAVSKDLYDAASIGPNPNSNPLCGLKLRLKRGNRSVDVTIVDRCDGCKPTDIDVSLSVFEKLALVEQGRVNVEWAWLDKPPITTPRS